MSANESTADMPALRNQYVVMKARAEACQRDGLRDAKREVHQAMFRIAKQLDDHRLMAQALGLIGLDAMEIGDLKRAETELTNSLTLLHQLHDDVAIGKTHANLSSLYRMQGKAAAALEQGDLALIYLRNGSNRQHEMVVLGNLAAIEIERGRFANAKTYLEPALDLARELESQHSEIVFRCEHAKIHQSEGAIAAAFGMLDEAMFRCRSSGRRRELGMVLGVAGMIATAEGMWERARMLLEQALVINRETRSLRQAGVTIHNLSLVALALGDPSLAMHYASDAMSIHRQAGNHFSETQTLLLRAEICYCSDDVENAETFLRQADALLSVRPDENLSMIMTTLQASLLAKAGDHATACAMLESAMAKERTERVTPDQVASRYRLAILHAQTGQFELARNDLDLADHEALANRSNDLSLHATIARCMVDFLQERAVASVQPCVDLILARYHHCRDRIATPQMARVSLLGNLFIQWRNLLLQIGLSETDVPLPRHWL